jgi:mRNA interferase MazF
MAPSSTGVIVLVPFPFSNLTQSKLRPALVLCPAFGKDWILCQITSNSYSDSSAIEIQTRDFASGSLHRVSYARPNKLFTAEQTLLVSEIGKLHSAKFAEIIHAAQAMFDNGLAEYK